MEQCPAGSACNSTAMGIIHSVIRDDGAVKVCVCVDLVCVVMMLADRIHASGHTAGTYQQ